MYLSKLIGSAAPKPIVVKEQKEEEEGLVSKLMKFLPMVGLVVGGLGGFLSSLLSGDFKNVLDQIKGGDFLGALQTAGKIILKTVEPYIQSIPIIGPIYSFAQAYLEIEKGNLVPGLKYIAQGVVGLLPFPMSVKAAMIGGVSVIGAIIENKYPQIKIPEGKGGDVLPIALKSIGKVLKIGVLKRLPLLGSAINFYEAYTAFEAGGPAGIAKGIINLSSGIANLFPGYGTLISIGLDIMSSLIFAEEETTDQSGRTVKKIKMTDFFFKAKEFLKNTPVLGNEEGMMYLHTMRGLAHIEEAIKWNSDGNFDRISAAGMLFILREDKYKISKAAIENDGKQIQNLSNDVFFNKNYNQKKAIRNQPII
jgi:hypothetical protein